MRRSAGERECGKSYRLKHICSDGVENERVVRNGEARELAPTHGPTPSSLTCCAAVLCCAARRDDQMQREEGLVSELLCACHLEEDRITSNPKSQPAIRRPYYSDRRLRSTTSQLPSSAFTHCTFLPALEGLALPSMYCNHPTSDRQSSERSLKTLLEECMPRTVPTVISRPNTKYHMCRRAQRT